MAPHGHGWLLMVSSPEDRTLKILGMSLQCRALNYILFSKIVAWSTCDCRALILIRGTVTWLESRRVEFARYVGHIAKIAKGRV